MPTVLSGHQSAGEQAISGRATEPGKNKPLIKGSISLRTPNAKGTKFFSTQTDSLGRFYIDKLELYGTQGIKLAAMNNKGEPSGRLTMDSVFNDTLKVRKTLSKPVQKLIDLTESSLLATVFWQPILNTNALGEATVSYYNASVEATLKSLPKG